MDASTRNSKGAWDTLSPFGIIPNKGKANTWRLIVDLSAHEGSSVNVMASVLAVIPVSRPGRDKNANAGQGHANGKDRHMPSL